MVFSEKCMEKVDVYFCNISFVIFLIICFGDKRDEHMTISTVKKYLVTKLGLSNEAEVIKLLSLSNTND